MGVAPSWYWLIQAAKYYEVPPWELAKQPLAYRDFALMIMSAEAHAQKQPKRRRGLRRGQ
jgi:hypothetical protein